MLISQPPLQLVRDEHARLVAQRAVVAADLGEAARLPTVPEGYAAACARIVARYDERIAEYERFLSEHGYAHAD